MATVPSSPLRPLSLKLVIKFSCERGPPYPWRKGVSLSLKEKGCQKNPNKLAPGDYNYLLYLNLPHFHVTAPLHQI